MNTIGSYTCCAFDSPTPQCVEATNCSKLPGICGKNASCGAENRCKCDEGFTGDGKVCQINSRDCILNNDLCDPNARCENRTHCVCKDGWKGDGVNVKMNKFCRGLTVNLSESMRIHWDPWGSLGSHGNL